MTTLRSVRNNNPGNIRKGGPWQGLEPVQSMTREQRLEAEFCVFKDARWGFRALAIVLRNYGTIHGFKTVREVISRLAPPTENDTEAYIADAAHSVGVKPDDPIDLGRRIYVFGLCKAIARHETGAWEPYWSDAVLAEGLDLAGF